MNLKVRNRESGGIVVGLVLIFLIFVLVVGFSLVKFFVLANTQSRNIAENAAVSAAVYYMQHSSDSDRLTKCDIVIAANLANNKNLTNFGQFNRDTSSFSIENAVEGLYDFSDPNCTGTCYTETIPSTSAPNALRLRSTISTGVGGMISLVLVGPEAFKFTKTTDTHVAFSGSTGPIIVKTN